MWPALNLFVLAASGNDMGRAPFSGRDNRAAPDAEPRPCFIDGSGLGSISLCLRPKGYDDYADDDNDTYNHDDRTGHCSGDDGDDHGRQLPPPFASRLSILRCCDRNFHDYHHALLQ